MDPHSGPGHLQGDHPAPADPFSGGDPWSGGRVLEGVQGTWPRGRGPRSQAPHLRGPSGSCWGGRLTQAAFLLPRAVPGTRATAPRTAGAPHSLGVCRSPSSCPSRGRRFRPAAPRVQKEGARGKLSDHLGSEAIPVAGSRLPCCTGGFGGLPRGTPPPGPPPRAGAEAGSSLRLDGEPNKALETLLITTPKRT